MTSDLFSRNDTFNTLTLLIRCSISTDNNKLIS